MFKVVWCFFICFGDVFLKDFPMFFGVLFINIASFVCENKDVGRINWINYEDTYCYNCIRSRQQFQEGYSCK